MAKHAGRPTKFPVSVPTEAELQWLVGWLEGEGTFYAYTDARTNQIRITVRAVSTDYDMAIKAHQLAGVGTISGPYAYSDQKPYWIWSINGKQPCVDFMRLVRPFMGKRRQKQIDAAIERVEHHVY
jgi:hypothetical protein